MGSGCVGAQYGLGLAGMGQVNSGGAQVELGLESGPAWVSLAILDLRMGLGLGQCGSKQSKEGQSPVLTFFLSFPGFSGFAPVTFPSAFFFRGHLFCFSLASVSFSSLWSSSISFFIFPLLSL